MDSLELDFTGLRCIAGVFASILKYREDFVESEGSSIFLRRYNVAFCVSVLHCLCHEL